MKVKLFLFIALFFYALVGFTQEKFQKQADKVYQQCLKENEASSCTSGCGMIIKACKDVESEFLNKSKTNIDKPKFCDDEEQIKFEKYSDVLNIHLSKSDTTEIHSACKIMPNDTSKAILAYSPPSFINDTSEVQSYDLVILIVDVSSAKVLYQLIDKSVIQSDALNYEMLSIDTANYMISSQQRAFGIRVSHRAGNNYSEDALNLYLQKDAKILKLLSGLIVSASRSDVNKTCDATYTDSASTLSMSTVKNNGFYNINVKTKEMVSVESLPINVKKRKSFYCDKKEKKRTNSQQVTFTDKAYLVPKMLKASMFH